jgi:hypothetical protein
MKYVVEIQSPGGDIARKQYDAPTVRSVMRAVENELKSYPDFRVIGVWARGERESPPTRGEIASLPVASDKE